MSAKKNDNIFKIIHTVSLSENTKIIGHKKCIVLKSVEKPGEQPFLLADIRAFLNDKATKVGVCLTTYEFDWLANVLLRHKSEESITLKSDKSPRTLSVIPKGKKTGGFYIEQQINDEIRHINLYKKEVKILVERYGTFYNIFEEMQENEMEESSDDEENEEIISIDTVE